MSFWLPDKYFSRISCIDIKQDIINCGLENILLDVDNTILTRDTSQIPVDVKNWIFTCKKSQLNMCLISNDWHSNVLDVASELDLPIVVRSLKPLPFAFRRACNKIGAKKNKSVMIGDQLMTDVLGAHLVGMQCYLLAPLVKQDLKHTLIMRKFERKILTNKLPDYAFDGGNND